MTQKKNQERKEKHNSQVRDLVVYHMAIGHDSYSDDLFCTLPFPAAYGLVKHLVLLSAVIVALNRNCVIDFLFFSFLFSIISRNPFISAFQYKSLAKGEEQKCLYGYDFVIVPILMEIQPVIFLFLCLRIIRISCFVIYFN
jgi:hypothetical protein